MLKKAIKEIEKTFVVKDVKFKSFPLNVKKLKVHKSDQFFIIEKDNQLIGYAYLGKAPSKTDEFDYLILIDKDLIIKKTKVLIYREDYGGEIGSKRWLKQFIGKSNIDRLYYEKDIMAISGATISARSMTIAINTFLKNITILKENNIL
ncbi:MAG: FMN-binding protein [Polaribacter sp.]|nr:FMN-binding protein [Polaribacter sp.]MDG1992884.1 FMN-binding protein [Polaribacter sp.]